MQLNNRAKQFFANKQGHIIIWQTPNFLLWAWIVLKVLAFTLHDGSFKTNLGVLSKAVLFAWSYLEITKGDSLFRRMLGAIIVTLAVVSFFK